MILARASCWPEHPLCTQPARYDHYLHVEHGDERALQRVLALQREQMKWMSPAELEAFRYRIMAGIGA